MNTISFISFKYWIYCK